MTRPCSLVFLHALGASARSFDPVVDRLGEDFDAVSLDLPGFGDTPTLPGLTVEDTVEAVERAVAGRVVTTRWMLVGHSMGGKIASVVASRTLAGSNGLFGLAGVVLLAGSPPSPEPMASARRADMIGWAGGGRIDLDAARTFVDANVGAPLSSDLDALAVADVLRTDAEAWLAWLERGSREDWSSAVGRLEVPATIVAGDQDEDLGVDAQPRLNGPVYPQARFVSLAGAGHLLPLERPAAVADAISSLWRERAGRGPDVPARTARAVASSHTGARARSALARRAVADEPAYSPQALSDAQLATLRAVAARVVPQDGPQIDLAARLDAQLARGEGDGWRFAGMPPDHEAHRRALDALAGFSDLDSAAQDVRLTQVAAGEVDGGGLTRHQLAQWFEDACTDLVRLWLAHPATMARIGFDGFANGGDGGRKQGFQLLGAGQYDGWEPLADGRSGERA